MFIMISSRKCKTLVVYFATPMRMLQIKRKQKIIKSTGEDVEEVVMPYTVGGKAKWVPPLCKNLAIPYKVKHAITIRCCIPIHIYTLDKWKYLSKIRPVYEYTAPLFAVA